MVSLPALATDGKKDVPRDNWEETASLLKSYLEWDEEPTCPPLVTFMIYDQESNLVQKFSIEEGTTLDDTDQIRLVAQSDFLMKNNNTLYYIYFK